MGAENSTLDNATSCNNANTCRGCKDFGNRQTDTVKIDMDQVAKKGAAAGKENAAVPPLGDKLTAEKLQQAERERQAQEEEERRRYEEQLERRRIEAEKVRQRAEEERRRREEEEEARQRQEEAERKEKERKEKEEAERRALEAKRLEEERRAKEAKAAAEKARREAEIERQRQIEEAKRQEEARIEQERQRLTARLNAFLQQAGFEGPNEKKVKKGMMSVSYSYPLHAAVEANDPKAIEVLLWAGADLTLLNSKKQTPLQLAQAKNNKQNSHAKVIKLLSAA